MGHHTRLLFDLVVFDNLSSEAVLFDDLHPFNFSSDNGRVLSVRITVLPSWFVDVVKTGLLSVVLSGYNTSCQNT